MSDDALNIWKDTNFSIQDVNALKEAFNDIKEVYELPSRDKKDWKGLTDDETKPDKEGYVIACFKKDFPDIKVSTFEEVMDIVSRSRAVRSWYARIDLSYVEQVNMPTYYYNYVDPKTYVTSMKNLTSLNKILTDDAIKRQKAAEKYAAALEELDDSLAREKFAILGKDKLLFIITLPSDMLPINITRAISVYSPKQEGAPTQKMYAREALINYKIYLLKVLKSKPDIDIYQFVKSRLF